MKPAAGAGTSDGGERGRSGGAPWETSCPAARAQCQPHAGPALASSGLFSVARVEAASFLPTVIGTQKKRKWWERKHVTTGRCECYCQRCRKWFFVMFYFNPKENPQSLGYFKISTFTQIFLTSVTQQTCLLHCPICRSKVSKEKERNLDFNEQHTGLGVKIPDPAQECVSMAPPLPPSCQRLLYLRMEGKKA